MAEKKQYLAKALLHQSAHEKSQKEVNDFSQQRLPFLLPHEWLSDYLHQPGAWAEAMPEEGTFYARKLAQACDSWGLPHGSMLPVGLFGDGVPVQGRMNQSTVDFWTLNLPCSSVFSSWTIPITCLDARMIGAPTIKAMCEIIHWSLDCLAKGKFPEARHDGSPWLASDSKKSLERLQHAWEGSSAADQV